MFDSLVNEVVSYFNKRLTNILGRKTECESGNDILAQLKDLLREQNQQILEVLSNIDISRTIEDVRNNQNDI